MKYLKVVGKIFLFSKKNVQKKVAQNKANSKIWPNEFKCAKKKKISKAKSVFEKNWKCANSL